MKKRTAGIICSVVFCITAVFLVGITAVKKEDYIKYVEFNVSYEALEAAMNYDINSQDKEIKIDWVDLLAYLGAKYGGDFKKYKGSDLQYAAEKLSGGETIEALTKDMKYFDYYKKAYGAVLGEFLGFYTQEYNDNGEIKTEKRYGLKVFSPIAEGFYYTHYDDFGASRSYGYKRMHLGHDLMAMTGTPVIAVEGGIVEALGWNQYGGWRIGIRSFDNKRYYYYAHLRQNRPYHADMRIGKTVNAGDVIGYVGRTGYSPVENVNGIETSHLHFGLQLIFDESQKEGNNEIWVNLYSLTKLLYKHRCTVYRLPETKEFYRKYAFSQ